MKYMRDIVRVASVLVLVASQAKLSGDFVQDRIQVIREAQAMGLISSPLADTAAIMPISAMAIAVINATMPQLINAKRPLIAKARALGLFQGKSDGDVAQILCTSAGKNAFTEASDINSAICEALSVYDRYAKASRVTAQQKDFWGLLRSKCRGLACVKYSNSNEEKGSALPHCVL